MASREARTSHDKDIGPRTPTNDGFIADIRDPNIVDWDGPDDPQNPQNWSRKQKITAVALVSLITFITFVFPESTPPGGSQLVDQIVHSPLASSIFAPSIEQVLKEFGSTNEELASFIVSVYLLGYCFGPLLVAPLSEMYGRLVLYHVCNVLFVIFSIACAVAPSLGSLIGFRFLAGLAGCCPLTNGAGTIADVVSREKRGAAMAAWVAGPLFGPVIGPIGRDTGS